MDDNALVSVIIPVYNGLPFLNEALDSVVKQTYKNLEIIVIDDGSTDGSGDLCDEYAAKDGRLRVIHQENKGLSAARNVGLEIMTGSAVAFLDADDAYRLDYIERMLIAMNKEMADTVICKYALYRTTNKLCESVPDTLKPKVVSGKYDRSHILKELVEGRLNPGIWNKLYSSNLWECIRFPEGRVYEEIDTTFQIFDKCRLAFAIDNVLYLYRKHKGTITDTISKGYIDDWLLSSIHFETYVEERIPELFTSNQLIALRQARLHSMIYYYATAMTKSKDWIDVGSQLRDEIITMGHDIGLGECSVRLTVCFWMICLSPVLLKVAIFLATRFKLLTIT